MNTAEFDADLVVDARDCIVGRVASNVAQHALDGDRVAIVNAERAVITGNEEATMDVYRTRAEVGSDSGPYYPKRPDRIFKRAVRGMIPYKTTSGREAFENVRIYVGNPHDEEGEVLEGTSLDRLSNIKFTSLAEVSEELGANVTMVTNTSGKKKTAVARATVSDGSGKVRINSQPVELVEPEQSKLKMLEPFRIAEADLREDIDIDVEISGGGFAGQADAARTAIARALVQHNNDAELRDAFLSFDRSLLVNDVRQSESKKWGGPGARARYQKSYR